jgi:hypothetical protein
MIVINKISPWLDSTYNNLYRRELVLAQENLGLPVFKPEPLYEWIHANAASENLFKGLAKLAPLFPVVGYNSVVSSWVRVVGSNRLSLPRNPVQHLFSSLGFFAKYDNSNLDEQQKLIRDAIGAGLATFDSDIVRVLQRYCKFFNTMPIYIYILDGESPLFGCGPAVVEGFRQADFSYEFTGEIKP